MKIQNKIILLILIIAFIFSASIYYFYKTENEKRSLQMKELRVEKSVLLEKAIDVLGKSLYNYSFDYTYWDEMVLYVKTRDLGWAKENIDLALETFNSQAAWVFDKNLSLIYTVNTYKDNDINNFPLLKKQLEKMFSANYFHHFFIKTKYGLMEIRTAPIQSGADYERVTTPAGYFIVGRIWNSSYIEEIKLLTQSEIELIVFDEKNLKSKIDSGIGVICYKSLKNDQNIPIAKIISKAEPLGVKESESIFLTQFIYTIVFAIVFIVLILLFLLKFINTPLKLISLSLSSGNMNLLKELKKGSNEFSDLARVIDEFFTQKIDLINRVNERNKAEETLKQHEELLHTLIDSMPDIVCFKDGNGRWLEANKFDLDLFELAKVDYRGKKDSELAQYSNFYREAFLACEDSDEVAWQSRAITRGEETIPKPDGTFLVFDIIKVPLFFSDGKRKGLVVIGRDITRRVMSEKALRESEAKYRRIFENVQDIFYQTDLNGIIIEISPSIERHTGYFREQLIGKPITDLYYNPAERERLLYFLNKLGELTDYEVVLKQRNGLPVHMSVNTHHLVDVDGKIIGVEGSLRDATERKIAEQELRKAKDKAEESETLKSEFLAQMSHEIRTPINAILSFSSLIRDELEDKVEPDLQTAFSIIKRAGRRIIRTIDLILNMSEIQTDTYDAHFKLVDIFDDIVAKNYEEFKHYANEKSIDLKINKSTNQTYLIVDEYTINQIFNNLIDNAIKYTIIGSVEVNLFTDKQHRLNVEVVDTGIGISPQYLSNLFTPFSQEEQGYTRKYEGNGLGLALVKKYCELNGAEIEVESEKGKGTTFRVVFERK
ncbi:MAG: PAS domain S-box protein [bacterium]